MSDDERTMQQWREREELERRAVSCLEKLERAAVRIAASLEFVAELQKTATESVAALAEKSCKVLDKEMQEKDSRVMALCAKCGEALDPKTWVDHVRSCGCEP